MSVLIFVLAIFLGFVPCMDLIPAVHDGALYVGAPIHDHAKVAFVDAIAREGLPPVNPIYSPGREILLGYYYFWHYMASQICVLTGIPGWPADVAFTWLTFSAVGAASASMALSMWSRACAGISTLLLLMCGSIPAGFPLLYRAFPGLYSGTTGGFAPLIVQATWVPQHLLAGVLVVLFYDVFCRAAAHRLPPGPTGVLLGSLAATILGSSVWIGLVFLIGLAVFLIRYLNRCRPGPAAWSHLWRSSALALLSGLILAGPLMVSMTSAVPPRMPGPVQLSLLETVTWSRSAWIHVVFYWIQFLPEIYGIVYFSGMAGLVWAPRHSHRAILFGIAGETSVLVFFSATLLMRSTLVNNDLGWRCPIVGALFLALFGGAALSRLFGSGPRDPSRSAGSGSGWRHRGLLILVLIGFFVGLGSIPRSLPAPSFDEPEALRDERRALLAEERAWSLVRLHAGPAERVLSNPFAFTRLTPWPDLNLNFYLFANRRTLLAHPGWIPVFCPREDPQELIKIVRLVSNIYSGNPTLASIGALFHRFEVKAILVHQKDAVWTSTALERSGLYVLAHREDEFKIYVARPRALRPTGPGALPPASGLRPEESGGVLFRETPGPGCWPSDTLPGSE